MKFWAVRLVSIALAFAGAFGAERLVAGLGNDYWNRLFVLAGLYVTLAVSLNLINGITGQFSIGHAAFYQVGAYAAGYVTFLFMSKQGMGPIPWLLAMCVVGALAAAVAGVLVGLPSLRLKGDYLAIVTLGFGEIIRITTQNIPAIGGSYGMSVPKIQAPWLVWVLAILCIAVCRNLLKTAHGLPFLSVREDEVASAAMGVNVTRAKVTAFVIGSAFAGMAGALLGHYEGFLTPNFFKMETSFIILTMVVLGGTGSITGSTLAAVALFGIPEYLRGMKDPVTGGPLMISGATLVGGMLAVILAVATIKMISDRYHGKTTIKIGLVAGAIVAGLILQRIFAALLSLSAQMAVPQYEVGMLRMVIFAATLIILMLLRPQGMLAHHEFSWDFVKRLLRLKTAEAPA